MGFWIRLGLDLWYDLLWTRWTFQPSRTCSDLWCMSSDHRICYNQIKFELSIFQRESLLCQHKQRNFNFSLSKKPHSRLSGFSAALRWLFWGFIKLSIFMNSFFYRRLLSEPTKFFKRLCNSVTLCYAQFSEIFAPILTENVPYSATSWRTITENSAEQKDFPRCTDFFSLLVKAWK